MASGNAPDNVVTHRFARSVCATIAGETAKKGPRLSVVVPHPEHPRFDPVRIAGGRLERGEAPGQRLDGFDGQLAQRAGKLPGEATKRARIGRLETHRAFVAPGHQRAVLANESGDPFGRSSGLHYTRTRAHRSASWPR